MGYHFFFDGWMNSPIKIYLIYFFIVIYHFELWKKKSIRKFKIKIEEINKNYSLYLNFLHLLLNKYDNVYQEIILELADTIITCLVKLS